MDIGFEVHAVATPAMLRSPPPQLKGRPFLYSLFGVQVGQEVFPADFWCDYSAVLLLEWGRQVRGLLSYESRYARLIFMDTPSEVWLRRTDTPYWKASCVTWDERERQIVAESLCLPEHVEASLDRVSRKLLEAARLAGVWYEDCEALDRFLNPIL